MDHFETGQMSGGLSRSLSIGLVFRNESHRLPSFFWHLSQAVPTHLKVEILGFDNGSTDASVELFVAECKKWGWQYQLQKSEHNNMAFARSELLRRASNEAFYFIDADIAVGKESLSFLLQEMHENANNPKVCAWAGPLSIASANEFQRDLKILQGTWWGNFGSPQMKAQIAEATVPHAPTAHLLVRRSAYMSVGTFDQRFDRTGEDLEIHLRLNRAGYQIAWVPLAGAVHDVAADWRQWAKKCFKYGRAQTQIARVHPAFWFHVRCLPFWLGGSALLLAVFRWPWFAGVMLVYLLILLAVAFGPRPERPMRVFALLVLTHASYFMGEVCGVLPGVRHER